MAGITVAVDGSMGMSSGQQTRQRAASGEAGRACGMSRHVAFGLACRATGDDGDMGMFGMVASCLASLGLGSNVGIDKQNL